MDVGRKFKVVRPGNSCDVSVAYKRTIRALAHNNTIIGMLNYYCITVEVQNAIYSTIRV